MAGHVITSASLALLAVVFISVSTQQADAVDCYLGHKEYKMLRLCCEGGSASPGVPVVTCRVNGTVFYLDDANRIRTRSGDYCLVIQGGYLVCGICGGSSTDWLFSTKDRFYSIVHGTEYASFNNKENTLLGTDKMTPKTYDANKSPRDFLAGWVKQDIV